MATPENTPKIDPVPEQKATEQPATESQALPVSKRPLYIKWVLIGGIILIVLLGGLYFFNKSATPPQALKQIPRNIPQTVSPSAQPTKPRSKAPGIIISIVTAKGIDPKTGEAVRPTAIFLTTDKSIYAVTTLQNAKVGTRIEYVRYLNNKFLDNRSITITKLNTNNTSFVWTLKNSTATHPVGEYKVKVYTNGIFEKEISYTVNQ
jgi:hypothetical protein